MTIAANQSIAGSGGWMKCTYPNTNQNTGISGISSSSEVVVPAALRKTGDYTIASYKVFLVNGEGNDFWDGTDDVMMIN